MPIVIFSWLSRFRLWHGYDKRAIVIVTAIVIVSWRGVSWRDEARHARQRFLQLLEFGLGFASSLLHASKKRN